MKKTFLILFCLASFCFGWSRTIIYGVPKTNDGAKHFGLSATFEAMEEWDMAIEEMQTVVEYEPDFSAGFMKLGELCGKSKQYKFRKLAEGYLDKAEQLDPELYTMAQSFRVQNEAREKIFNKRFWDKMVGDWAYVNRGEMIKEFYLQIYRDYDGNIHAKLPKKIYSPDNSEDIITESQEVHIKFDKERNSFYFQGKDWNVVSGYRVYYDDGSHIALAIFVPYADDTVLDDTMRVILYMNGNPIYEKYLIRR